MAYHVLTHEISKRGHLPVCPRSASGTTTTERTQAKNFCRFVLKRYREKERKESKKKGNCNAFCVIRKRNKNLMEKAFSF